MYFVGKLDITNTPTNLLYFVRLTLFIDLNEKTKIFVAFPVVVVIKLYLKEIWKI